MLNSLFVYNYELDKKEEDETLIRAYGIDNNNKTVCLKIRDFTPYLYLGLPDNIEWNTIHLSMLNNKIDRLFAYCQIVKRDLVYKKKLYYVHKKRLSDGELNDELYPYLFLSFPSQKYMRFFNAKLRNYDYKLYIPTIGHIKIDIREYNVDPILQLVSFKDIPTSGWINYEIDEEDDNDPETSCDYEYSTYWKNLSKCNCDNVIKPCVVSFDLEVYSSDRSRMPQATEPKDVIFQISFIVYDSNNTRKILLTLGNPNPELLGNDIEYISYTSELKLLLGFTNLIQMYNPHVIIGYNIMGFDIPYMIDRAGGKFALDEFKLLSFRRGLIAQETTVTWESSAYGKQDLRSLIIEGRIIVDLLPLIQRDYKFGSYKLKNVADYFLGTTKDPLTEQDIFECWERRTPDALSLVGRYCIVDSVLVLELYNKLQIWVGLSEMAKVFNVQIPVLYTRGQQIKVFSQMYKACLFSEYVIDREIYKPDYTALMGATVFPPKPGLYNMIVPMDFASLYPSIMIAYNICWSTYVLPENDIIHDDECHNFKWDEHCGCEHDKTVRKQKPKNIICQSYDYRFLKNPMGILPSILVSLLDARKKTRKQINEIEGKLKDCNDIKEKERMEALLIVLDKRQLAYKISANSAYGTLGVDPDRALLPLHQGARTITSRGREAVLRAAQHIRNNYGGDLIYGDTDSVMLNFPFLKSNEETWEFAKKVETEIAHLFPSPMKLEFENIVYYKFLILSKKRYITKIIDKNGKISEKTKGKGVLTVRRDNCEYMKDRFNDMIKFIFDEKSKEFIVDYLLTELNKMFCDFYDMKKFIITKSVKDKESYKIRKLPEDPDKLEKRLQDLGCTTEQYYDIKGLPAHVQLAEKLRARGMVIPGGRLEYVVTTNGERLSEQYEEASYFHTHSEILSINYLYYTHFMSNQFDQVLEVVYGEKNLIKTQHKLREIKQRVMAQILELFAPTIRRMQPRIR